MIYYFIYDSYMSTYLLIYARYNFSWSGSLLNRLSMLECLVSFWNPHVQGGALFGRPIAWEELKGYCTDGHLPRLGTARFNGMALDVTWWSIIFGELGRMIPKKGNRKNHPNKQTKCWLINLGAVDSWKLNGKPQQAVGKLPYKQPSFRFLDDFSVGQVACVFCWWCMRWMRCVFLVEGWGFPMHILCILHTITTCYICNHNLIDISYICLYLSQVVYSNTYTYKHILYV